MTRPYSQDLRERALARYEAGASIRSIGAALAISPSCALKWHKLKRETGSLAPSWISGHKKPVLSGPRGLARTARAHGAIHPARVGG
jgi:transposase